MRTLNFRKAAHIAWGCIITMFWLTIATSTWAQPNSPTTQASNIRPAVSLGDSLQRAGQGPVHIFYVHGIGATGSGDSAQLRKSICGFLKDCTNPDSPATGRETADQGMFAPGAPIPALTYMGSPVWSTQQAWQASAPFVDHYVLQRKNGQKILLDEINWWPLVFPLKCNNILIGEAQLAGINSSYISTCERVILNPALQSLQAVSSTAVPLNRAVKISLMDWGFSDALMAAGPMQKMMVQGIRQLVLKSVAKAKTIETGAPLSADEYVAVSHSLGSFLIFAALNLDNWSSSINPSVTSTVGTSLEDQQAALGYVLQHLSQVYFFANQVPLMELAELDGGAAATIKLAHFSDDLKKWAAARNSYLQERPADNTGSGYQPQIVAWSDPNDLLTWHVPDIEGVSVVNLMAANSFRWLWLAENPIAAHDNYDQNPHVIRLLMKPIAEHNAK